MVCKGMKTLQVGLQSLDRGFGAGRRPSKEGETWSGKVWGGIPGTKRQPGWCPDYDSLYQWSRTKLKSLLFFISF